jgi:uncharacterized protein (TIGR03067 family)
MARFLLIVSITAIGITPVRADEKADLAALQGTWLVQRAVRNGDEAPDVVRDVLRVTISGRTLTIRSADDVTTVEDEVTLDPSKSPAQINLKPVRSKTQAMLFGIYQIDGETVRLCWTEGGGPRPTQFASAPGSKVALVELKKMSK